jgi:hypothetical protein
MAAEYCGGAGGQRATVVSCACGGLFDIQNLTRCTSYYFRRGIQHLLPSSYLSSIFAAQCCRTDEQGSWQGKNTLKVERNQYGGARSGGESCSVIQSIEAGS